MSGFYIIRENMVQSLGTKDGQTISGQVGKADSKGLEVDINTRPLKGLNIEAGYTFTIAKLKEYAKNEYAENTQAGNYLNYVPKHMAYGWAFYDFGYALKGFKIGAGFNYSSKAFVNTANTMEFDAYAIANAMASYSYRNWRLQMNINNIFDKTYYTAAVNTVGFIPEEGRNVRFSISFDI